MRLHAAPALVSFIVRFVLAPSYTYNYFSYSLSLTSHLFFFSYLLIVPCHWLWINRVPLCNTSACAKYDLDPTRPMARTKRRQSQRLVPTLWREKKKKKKKKRKVCSDLGRALTVNPSLPIGQAPLPMNHGNRVFCDSKPQLLYELFFVVARSLFFFYFYSFSFKSHAKGV